ncbi:MAG: YihY/virulence factor BrkB family protein [Bacteroidota bacterium]|nr:YihY/virulence factor BrkB family protein [Bacteroidota bacterium]
MILRNPSKIFSLLEKAFKDFRANDPLRMAGATAFFTTFALPAVLIILIQVFGLITSPRLMTHQLLQNLADVIGDKTAGDLRLTMRNVRHLTRTWWVASGGFLFLIFVATTLFKVIRDSLNQLWNIRLKDHVGFGFNLLNRAKSFLAILAAGILFLAALLGEGFLNLLKHSPNDHLFSHGLLLSGIGKQLISLLVVTTWFSILFKFLPDGRPTWKTAFAGGLFTAILFAAGKWILQWLLSHSSMQTIYGASTSSVLLLLFVFYSSFIFYYGACFTKEWGTYYNHPIQPGKHAEQYQWSSVKGKIT